MESEYAFGEIDDFGRSNLASFAARADNRADIDFRPAEGRIYVLGLVRRFGFDFVHRTEVKRIAAPRRPKE